MNREPIRTLQVSYDLVEIQPGGSRVLSSTTSGRSLVRGDTAYGTFFLSGAGRIRIESSVVDLSADGTRLSVAVRQLPEETILSQETLTLVNYQEVLIELAEVGETGSRLAVRLVPKIDTIEPILDFQGTLREFRFQNAVVILNAKSMLSYGASAMATVDPDSGWVQVLQLNHPTVGAVRVSYRPFGEARFAGYFKGGKLVFELNDELIEWYSIDCPFLPEGKWAAFVERDSRSSGSESIGVSSARQAERVRR